MADGYFVAVTDIELLAVSTGQIAAKSRVILTIRLNPADDFEPISLALQPKQAQRLLRDLERRFQNSEILKGVTSEDEAAEEAYRNIVLERPIVAPK